MQVELHALIMDMSDQRACLAWCATWCLQRWRANVCTTDACFLGHIYITAAFQGSIPGFALSVSENYLVLAMQHWSCGV